MITLLATPIHCNFIVSYEIEAWMRGATRYPLLSASQELMLAASVRAMLDSPDPTPQQIKRGKAAREKMINCNLRLAAKCAFGFRKRIQAVGGDLVDALQESVIGLNRAVDKFDHTRGYKFSTYATLWCNQAVRRYIQCGAPMIRPPAHAQDVCRRYKYRPKDQSAAEFCEIWGLTAEKLQQELQHAARATCASLDAPTRGGAGDGNASNLLELIAADGDQEGDLAAMDMQQALTKLRGVCPDEVATLERLLALGTATAVAKELSINRETATTQIRQARVRLAKVAGPEVRALVA